MRVVPRFVVGERAVRDIKVNPGIIRQKRVYRLKIVVHIVCCLAVQGRINFHNR
jgi:hypothetical protein